MESVKTFFRMFRQLNALLKFKDRVKLITIIVLSFVAAFLETLGVSAMLPFIITLLQPSKVMEYKIVKIILDFLDITTEKSMVIAVAIGVVVVFAVKNIFIIAFGVYKYRFQSELERSLSQKMFYMYINKDYKFFLHSNTAEIEKGVSSDTSAVSTCVGSFCSLINEFLTCGMIGVALLIINPIMAIWILIMAAIITLTMIQTLRKKISVCGSKTRKHYIGKTNVVIEMMGGIKEILVLKRQKLFFNKFAKQVDEAVNWNTRFLSLSLYPSRLTELSFITGLVILVVVLYFSVDDPSMIMAQFSALAVAALRILPSTASISNSVNSLVFHRPYLENAYEIITNGELKEIDFGEDDQKKLEYHINESIELSNVSWKYEEGQPNILDNVSLKIEKGDTIGIIGESGAGKTTLIDIILGLYKPQIGMVTIDGKDIYDKNTHWEKYVGYVPQNVFIMDDTVKNNVLFGIPESEADEEKLQRALDKSRVSKFISDLPRGISTVLGEDGTRLSGGQKQRIAIARVLYENPDIIILDEATAALDNETESEIIDSLNVLKGEKTIIIVAHRLTTIENCNKVYKVENGKVIAVDKAVITGDV